MLRPKRRSETWFAPSDKPLWSWYLARKAWLIVWGRHLPQLSHYVCASLWAAQEVWLIEQRRWDCDDSSRILYLGIFNVLPRKTSSLRINLEILGSRPSWCVTAELDRQTAESSTRNQSKFKEGGPPSKTPPQVSLDMAGDDFIASIVMRLDLWM